MAIDVLQDKIRKLKNPSMIDLTVKLEHIPTHILAEEGSPAAAYARFCAELLEALKDTVPAVRLSFDTFALMGPEGLICLTETLKKAREAGYYILLDSPGILTPWNADMAARCIIAEGSYDCDGLLISPYIGSDAMKPFVLAAKESDKDIFIAVRSPNKTAAELQDLLTGTRHVNGAAAELVNRFAGQTSGKYGYSRIATAGAACAPDNLRMLRAKYNRMFLLVDGLDYPSGNAKNCSFAFDRFGYGAVVCAGPSVTVAWQDGESDERDYTALALRAAERMKKSICRYIDIL